jgi:3-isopropylmalate/(R)-2-methylmalate dehydratase large subunit
VGRTLIEKIIAAHTGDEAAPGATVEMRVDVRAARDFGGANVVGHLEEHDLGVADPERTLFTFDCNPTGSDQGYAANQQRCRLFARRHGLRVYDIDRGIGTHLVIEEGLVGPGETFVSTDSHANILGAVGAFGQGMGDLDIASAFARGSVWFQVPETVRVHLTGTPSAAATAKDLTLALVRHFGASGLLGCAVEVTGEAVSGLDLAGRLTLASMATEMGAIILFPEPSARVAAEYARLTGRSREWLWSDHDAISLREEVVDVAGLEPLVSRPGHPEDVVALTDLAGTPIDSAFLGSCTNGRLEDLAAAARILQDRRVAEGVVLKVVPATDRVWIEALRAGLLGVFKKAGVLVSNAGCAGCAAGQVGQTGPGEITVSSGNRNFPGKQGLGEVFLASPETVAASAVTGVLTPADRIDRAPPRPRRLVVLPASSGAGVVVTHPAPPPAAERPMLLEGRVWVLDRDSVDTDMIFHNRHLALTDPAAMGRHALGNVPGWEDFPERARPGDFLITGANFGAGSSRQQAVDCFRALGLSGVIASSFGAIYERNAINAGFPVLRGELRGVLKEGERIRVDLGTGEGEGLDGGIRFQISPMSPVQLRIYLHGGLLAAR